MSEQKMVTEREAVMRERAAVSRTVEHLFRMMRASGCRHIEEVDGRRIEDKWYPLPKVTRPRVLQVDGIDHRVVDGKLEWRGEGYDYTSRSCISLAAVPVVADLLANPTEEVDA